MVEQVEQVEELLVVVELSVEHVEQLDVVEDSVEQVELSPVE